MVMHGITADAFAEAGLDVLVRREKPHHGLASVMLAEELSGALELVS